MEKYRPSNGTEGELFQAQFCENCTKDHAYREGDYANGCPILAATLSFSIDDERYPEEWIYDNGNPTCTAYDPEPLNSKARSDSALQEAK